MRNRQSGMSDKGLRGPDCKRLRCPSVWWISQPFSQIRRPVFADKTPCMIRFCVTGIEEKPEEMA